MTYIYAIFVTCFMSLGIMVAVSCLFCGLIGKNLDKQSNKPLSIFERVGLVSQSLLALYGSYILWGNIWG